ncbi:hypothetical protein [Streptomyces sp. NRRL S-1448]|uniref:hypothetical protein n=1 Tax=Streptomyces sp. NRRL S-1448 TaxID=1463883 RepID=UPI000ADB9D60|nr:hypothetical protein [Streptomyces sp. NRRL S-1448]
MRWCRLLGRPGIHTTVGVLTGGNGESTQKVPAALKEALVEPSFGAKPPRLG